MRYPIGDNQRRQARALDELLARQKERHLELHYGSSLPLRRRKLSAQKPQAGVDSQPSPKPADRG